MARFLFLALVPALVRGDLSVSLFGNSALHGPATTNNTVKSLDLEIPLSASVGSAEVTGEQPSDCDQHLINTCKNGGHAVVEF